MIQIPTNARQQMAHAEAQRLRRQAFANFFTSLKGLAVKGKGRPVTGAGLKARFLPRSGEVLRPIGGNG